MRKFICGSRTLVLSLALSLVAGFTLSSCDDSNEETEPEVVEMREFFLSVNEDGEVDCGWGDSNVRLSGDESTGKLSITMTSVNLEGFEQDFWYSGDKIIQGSEKTIVTSLFGANDDGSYDSPGVSYLTSTTNDKILQGDSPAMMFAGFWSGKPSRTTNHPVVLCPHLLIPRDVVGTDGMPITCGGSDGANMSEGLKDYLGSESGEGLGTCYKTLEGTRLLVPMAVQ